MEHSSLFVSIQYALLYQHERETKKCDLDHVCFAFFSLCFLNLMLMLLLLLLMLLSLVHQNKRKIRKREREKEKENILNMEAPVQFICVECLFWDESRNGDNVYSVFFFFEKAYGKHNNEKPLQNVRNQRRREKKPSKLINFRSFVQYTSRSLYAVVIYVPVASILFTMA